MYPQKNKFASAAFWLGLLSIILWELSAIPIIAITFGLIALIQIHKSKDNGTFAAIIGIILGVLFLLVRIYK